MSQPVENCRRRAETFHAGNPTGERSTWSVVGLSAVMMVVEIVAGRYFHSMALLADGWHMATHVAALCVTAGAYWLARRHAADPRFAFGTWKIEVLGGFTSAVILGVVALSMTWESLERLWQPTTIRYDEAIVVSVLGLLVNLASAWLLVGGDHGHAHGHGHAQGHGDAHERGDGQGHSHAHGHSHAQGPDHGPACDGEHGPVIAAAPSPPSTSPPHHDLNLRAAYVHVVTDALTSVLAIVALVGGKWLGWARLDPAMGLVGAGLVGVWAYRLLKQTAHVLLDREMDHPLVSRMRELLEADGAAQIVDLHVWRVGRNQFAGVVTLRAGDPQTPDAYRRLLASHPELVHLTVEVESAAAADDPLSARPGFF